MARRLADWQTQAAACGLPNLPLDAAPTWLKRHQDALELLARRQTAEHQLQTLHQRVEALRQALTDRLALPATTRLDDALRLDEPLPVQLLPGFGEGLVSVQDGSAQQAADALAPEQGARVLDACAAPGGKAVHLLERDPELELLALDLDPRRLPRIEENLRRSGVADPVAGGRVQVRAADATLPALWWDGFSFDAILLDAPCSATGVVRRQPDILLHRRAADLEALLQLQARLLDATWTVLRPGGVLLYATCSILAAENADQVQAFLERTPDARAQALPEAFGHLAGPGRQRLPGEGGMDGFFYARLQKSD